MILASVGLGGCATYQTSSTEPAASSNAPTTPAPGTVSCTYRSGGTPAVPVDPPVTEDVPATGTTAVTMKLGGTPITIELDQAAAPCTVNSFLSLAEQGYYTQTSCHRLSTTGIFILQCGDPTGTGTGGPGYTFDDELEATTGYPAGSLAMANAGPNTNGSQFFFVYEDTPLPTDYTVFGHLSAEDNEAIAGIAFQGHDASNSDGTGVPNAPTEITEVVSG